MKVCKQIEIKYYKYTDIDWVQPALTSNGTISGDSFAVSGTQKTDGTQSIWMAFDNSSSTVWCPVAVANPANAYCIIYNPKALKVLKLTILNRNVASVHVTGYEIHGSNDNINWDLLTTGTNNVSGSSATWEIQVNSENYYEYYKFLITSGKYTSQTSCSIAEIKIMAQEQIVVNGTEEDYDFYTEEEIYSLPTETIKKYYKYIIGDFVQPILAMNDTSKNFIITDSIGDGRGYNAFDGINSTTTDGVYCPHTSAGSFSGANNWLQMYSVNGLNITNIAVSNRNNTCAVREGNIQVSENGEDWIKISDWVNNNTTANATWNIPVSYEGFYKYIRIYFTKGTSTGTGTWVGLTEIKLTATQQEPIISTEQNYDFYTEGKKYKAIK